MLRELDSLPPSSASLFSLQIGNESLHSHGHRQERSAEIAFTHSNRSRSGTDQLTPELRRREIKLSNLRNQNTALYYKNSQLAMETEHDFLAYCSFLRAKGHTYSKNLLCYSSNWPGGGNKKLYCGRWHFTLFDTRIWRAHALYSQAIRGTEDDKYDIGF